MNITINGKICACEKGEFLLAVARRNGILIPTLCHHPALAGQGLSGRSGRGTRPENRGFLCLSYSERVYR